MKMHENASFGSIETQELFINKLKKKHLIRSYISMFVIRKEQLLEIETLF